MFTRGVAYYSCCDNATEQGHKFRCKNFGMCVNDTTTDCRGAYHEGHSTDCPYFARIRLEARKSVGEHSMGSALNEPKMSTVNEWIPSKLSDTENYLSQNGFHHQGEVRTTSSTGGQKGVKPERYDLIPVGPLRTLAQLYGKGAQKYDDHNWRKGYEFSKSYQALQRHVNQFWGGENNDEEMGLSHLASVIFHAMALMELVETHPEFDDRYVIEKEEGYTSDSSDDA